MPAAPRSCLHTYGGQHGGRDLYRGLQHHPAGLERDYEQEFIVGHGHAQIGQLCADLGGPVMEQLPRIGGYARRRAKTGVALGDGFPSASLLGWQSSCLRPDGMARVLPVPVMLDPCGAVTSTGGTVSRRMPCDMCQRRHTASHPSFQDQSRPRDRGEVDPAMFVSAALRVTSGARRLTRWPES